MNAAALLQRFKAETVARIGQRIQHHDPIIRILSGPVIDKVGTNKARTTGDQ